MLDKERGYYLGSDNCLYEVYNRKYYKVEPIKWKVMSKVSGGEGTDKKEQFIVSDKILDWHRFAACENNYANSEIRGWLNEDFFNKAFSEDQKNMILTTMVDNSASSTGSSVNIYRCCNTSDKIFLLSYKEVNAYVIEAACPKKGTDYAKARDLGVDSQSGYSSWWLRSPCDSKGYAQLVDFGGKFTGENVCINHNGVVPALKIKP